MQLRLATFNLESLDDQPGLDPPLATRIAILRPQLLRLDADVLCLQEVNGQRVGKGADRALLALERLLMDTPYASFARATTTRLAGGQVADVHNLVVLSRFPFADVSEIMHRHVAPPTYRPTTAEPPAADPNPLTFDRPILRVRLNLADSRSFTVFNLHLRAPLASAIPGQKEDAFTWRTIGGWAEGFFMSAVKRAGQALEARLAIEKVFDQEHEAFIAVCGDFNASLDENPTRIVRGAEEDTGNGCLAARALVPIERGIPADRRYTVVHHGRRQMPDHILLSHPLLAHFRGLDIHNEMLEDELVGFARVQHDPQSYHAPVSATFEFTD